MSKETILPPRPQILIVDDTPANLMILRDALEPEGYKILAVPNGKTALRVAAGNALDLILLDIVMPGMDGYNVCQRLKADEVTAQIPVIFITIKDEKASLVKGFSVGGVDYITKPFEKEEVLVRVRTHLEISHLTNALRRKNAELQQEIVRRQQAEADRQQAREDLQKADEQLHRISQQELARWGIAGFVGKSQTIKRILGDVLKLQEAGTTSVLIAGESGTGKELIARAIHFGGARAKGPFVPINCSAIPSELAESTLFGHIRGAFTGANATRKGYFELASGGTLFLDEIGEMPLELQSKLLRVLEDGVITPVGTTEENRVDVRVLAATNADLQVRMREGRFRKDLYFRLTRFIVNIPPLRERKEDIPLLVAHFLKMFATEMGTHPPGISQQALSVLTAYHFPGNIRELKNIIEYALIKCGRSGEIEPEHLHLIESGGEQTATSSYRLVPAFSPPPEQAETLMIKGALAETNGDVSAAAHLLGIPSTRIERLLQIEHGKNFNGSASRTTGLPRQETDEDRIYQYVQRHGSINNAECRDLLNVDINRANYLLNKMYRGGILKREGGHRWTRYTLR